MNQKAQTFAALAESTASQLTKSYTEWTGFLSSIGRLYKYPYIEQVFIYAQRPEATACASYDVWNKRMSRVVRRGCKGIALPDAGENSRGLRYVFDIEDTVSRNGSRRPYVWEYLDEHEKPVTRILGEKYGITDEGGLVYQLEAIAQELAGGYWEDHMEDILASIPGSFLEEFDELNVEMAFRDAASVSTAYVLFSRCGLDPSEQFSQEDFMPVFDFNTLDAVTALGTAVSENSEQVLRQIEITVKNYERARRMERRELYGEQPDLPAGGGLPVARIRGGNTIDFGEIRTDAGEVSAGGAPGTVQPSDSKREAVNTLEGDRPDSQREIGADDAGTQEIHGPDGAAESPGPHEVGGPDEQRESESGGTDFAGTHLHLTAPAAPTGGISDSSAEEQIVIQVDEPARDDDYIPNLFELAGSTIPLVSEPLASTAPIRPLMAQDVIDAALTLGANDRNSRLRIIAEFMKNKPLEENVRFLQAHYKENGAGFYMGERKYSLWYNEAGMQIAPGESAQVPAATALTWEQAAGRIRELLDEGKYASQAMLYRAWPFEKNRVAQALQYLHRDIDEDYKDKYLPTLTAALDGTFIYPDVVDKTKELLDEPEQLQSVIDEFAIFQKDYAHNRNILRFRHRPDEIMQGLVDLQCTPLIFAASPDFAPVERFFISQDEIDSLLREQPQANDRRIALYNFFEQHHDRKELTFSHGSITNPYAAIKLKWPQVRKRIEELIHRDKFLSAEDREIMESRTLEMPSEESPAPPVEPEPLSEQSEDEPVRDSTFQYRRLSQMKADCEYFLGAGNRKNKHLWEESVFSHIKEMRRIYELLPEKPEWLTMEEIDSYAKRMTPESENIIHAEPQMVPNLAEYARIKEAFPSQVVGVQNGDMIYFYGTDAEKAGPVLNRNVLTRSIPGMGAVSITGDAESWQASKEKLLRKGVDLTFVRLDDAGQYEVFVSQTAAEYIPVGMELDVEGRRCRIESVDFQQDAVHLTVLDSGTALTESIRYVREFVGDAYTKELEKAAEKEKSQLFVERVMEDVAQLAEQEQAATVRDLYEKYKAEIITALSSDQPYRNACQNSDKDTAYLEGAAAIKRVVLAAGDDTLTKLYFDNVKFHNDLHRETLDETYPLFSGPEQATTVQDEPPQETNTPEDLTDLQKKAREIAKRYEDLPVQEKIGIIAQTFGCTSGQIETSPCTGKWRGTSDISIRFDNGVSLFVGNESTPKARTAKVRNEYVNNMLVWYNPEIARITKETALAALKQREKKDNAIAAEKGLKPYTVLNVELHNGTHGKDSGYIGWYYVTLAVDGKIHAHLESGLNHEISFGKAGESPTGEEYFVAGALKETEVDYVFNNVGYSSTSGLYTLPISDEVRERAKKTLAEIPQPRDPLPPTGNGGSLRDVLTGEGGFHHKTAAPEIPPKPASEKVSTEPVAIYPAEKNNLPFDVVIEKLHTEEPQRGPKPQNFQITDDNLGYGGAKAKYQMNMAALHALQKIESENRTATPEEQAVLSKYVGWGALADAFDAGKPDWAAEYKELRETLAPEEYESALGSTLNAHYTSPTVVKAIYQALENMGFKGGNILEPSCGVGNFFGLLPESMAKSKLYGVELDGLTGRIAKQLYPNAHIEIKGYEQTSFEKNSFDIAIGNVPFGNYRVHDPAYNKLGFSIHNYFFAKTIDQVRPGGIIAFVTSRFTMDSKSTKAREYMAQRAELLGAIRLPNNAFLANAGTGVVSDILFLQKRERPIAELPDWVHTDNNKDGFAINRYFIQHPEMVLGELSSKSTQYAGEDFTVNPLPGADLGELLREAVSRVEGYYAEAETVQVEDEKEQESIPAAPEVKNFSYTIVKGDVYYRQDSVMVKMELGAAAKVRTMALIDLRDCTQRLINEQLEGYAPDESIRHTQEELNRLYDNFTAKFGLINDKINERAFSQDSSYYLLCALEILDDEGKFVRKSDMFTKRTIYPHQQITHVDTAAEALAVSIGERARVDIPFMAGLTGKAEDEIIRDLQGQIYRVPMRDPPIYQTADEYLSGNVREKLKVAEAAATVDPAFNINVNALAAVQPRDLDASEISVRLGTDWIEPEYVEQFMRELLKTPGYAWDSVHVQYSSQIKVWNISNKSIIRKNDVAAYSTYGTKRASAYELLESALNLKTARIYDIKEENGKEKRVLNAKETTLAQQKQEMMKLEFQNWIWKDPDRRQNLVRKYNDEMNSIRPRQYDGSHLVLSGMNPEIQLEEHQKNAIARAVYGGNTLFAHCVGAGKTFEITASAMEMKRLGLCSKSMIVVPNHLTQQWASEFLRLYPNANILVTTKRDFEKDRRKKFCSRIATGDYDAVIIGYSQFERIPISRERQINLLSQQIDDIVEGIRQAKEENGQRFTVKQLERTKKSLEARLERLQADDRKDDVVNFEELGVDRLFVDEADNFKNMFLYTKMRNVAGLSTSEAQKSSDMFNKTRYLDEITDYKGVIFATGTPISNSITEMYTMQRYLQYNALRAMGMEHFDSWASRFGETVTTMELAPEGTGYRPRERFAKFFNLPELMNLFHEVADIKTEDMLNLPTPDVEFHNIVAEPTEFQKAYVQELSERATAVRIGAVAPTEDNLLKITNDGRKLGLDQRLIDPSAEDAPDSKLNLCVDNILQFWEEGKEDKLTQLVFCDLSTPKKDGSFNVYEDIKRKLVERGVPENEIAFIHDAETEVKKKELFAKVRSGKVRVLIGSTQKLGAGTNVQDRLITLHHLDCPWRPRDLTQREGRIVRRGNNNPLVHVFRYATEGTFDSYLWQTVEKKQQFIGQIMTSKSPARTCEDVDEAALSYAEVKALCAGDPRIKERMELDVEVAKLQVMQASHRSQQYDLEDKIRLYFPQERQRLEWRAEGIQIDLDKLAAYPLPKDDYIGIELLGQHFAERKAAGAVLLDQCKQVKECTTVQAGSYRGLKVLIKNPYASVNKQIILKGAVEYAFDASDSDIGNITRMDNALERLPEELEKTKASLENIKQQMESAKAEVGRPFPQEQELKDKLARIAQLDVELEMRDHAPKEAVSVQQGGGGIDL